MRLPWVLGLGVMLYGSGGLAAEAATQDTLTPQIVLQNLKDGNERFLNHKMLHRDFEKEMLDSKYQQTPHAVVLSCMDSRSIPSLTFDQGIGDVFSIRVAGNVLSDDMIGSMEYGAAVVGSKLIVVMGHTRCGAVVSACKNVELGHITDLINKIKPAVQTLKKIEPHASCEDYPFVDRIAKQNVLDIMNAIPKQSSIIANLLREKKIAIVGAMYEVKSGKVVFLDEET